MKQHLNLGLSTSGCLISSLFNFQDTCTPTLVFREYRTVRSTNEKDKKIKILKFRSKMCVFFVSAGRLFLLYIITVSSYSFNNIYIFFL